MGGAKGVDIRKNSIRITFTWDGKQRRQTIVVSGEPLAPTPPNIRYAERLAAEIREKIRLGSFSMVEYFPESADTESAATITSQIALYLSAKRITPSTMAAYQSAMRFWSSALDGATVKTLKHSQVLKAIASRPDLSGKTLTNYLSVLRDSLDLALRDGLIKSNPVEGIDNPGWQRDPPDPFSDDERERIIDLAATKYPGHVHNMLEFWFWSGLRTGELLGLRWENVDLPARQILVRESVVRGERRQSTKTATARTLILNSRAIAAIGRQRPLTQMVGGPVFLDPRTLTPWEKEQPFRQNYWKHILRALGIRYRRAYCCRHTYATAMLMAGMTPAFCARQLGHSVEMFLRTYSKWIDGQRDDLEMRRLEQSLGDKPGIKAGNQGE